MYLTPALHRSVQQQPHAVATVCGDRKRTFAELADRVARLAGGLRAAGVAAGDRVAYLGLNSDRYHEFYLAVAWAGAVAVPVKRVHAVTTPQRTADPGLLRRSPRRPVPPPAAGGGRDCPANRSRHPFQRYPALSRAVAGTACRVDWSLAYR